MFSKTSLARFPSPAPNAPRPGNWGRLGLETVLLALGPAALTKIDSRGLFVWSEIPPGEIPEREAKKAMAGVVGP